MSWALTSHLYECLGSDLLATNTTLLLIIERILIRTHVKEERC